MRNQEAAVESCVQLAFGFDKAVYNSLRIAAYSDANDHAHVLSYHSALELIRRRLCSVETQEHH